jgi:predicted nucleotidyltransferase
VIRASAAAARDALGGRLTSTYAIGSLAHGGFSAAASDVDLALLTEDVVEPPELRRIAEATEAELDTELSRRLSIFHAPWRSFAAPPAEARFPALDRLDLVRHGVPVDGDDVRAATPEPARGEVVAEAIGFGLEHLGSEPVRAAIRRPSLGDLRETTKLVLFPVRLLFVARTGRVGSNEDAAAHYHEATGPSRLEVVDEALRWRRQGTIPDRGGAELLRSHLLPLHRQVVGLLSETPGLPMRDPLMGARKTYESW